jgi:hypothetical protein
MAQTVAAHTKVCSPLVERISSSTDRDAWHLPALRFTAKFAGKSDRNVFAYRSCRLTAL